MEGELPPNGDTKKGKSNLVKLEDWRKAKEEFTFGTDFKKDPRKLTEDEEKEIGLALMTYRNEFISKIEPDATEIIRFLTEQDKLIMPPAASYERYRQYLMQTDEYKKTNFSLEEIENFEEAQGLENLIKEYSGLLFLSISNLDDEFLKLLNRIGDVDENNPAKQAILKCRKKLELNQSSFEGEIDNKKRIKMLEDFIEKNKKE